MTKIFTIKIAGEAGMGIKSTGQSLLNYLNSLGYFVYNYLEYPSLIRGGHNVSQILFHNEPVRSPRKENHFLVALDQLSLDQHAAEMSQGGIVICDSESEYKTESVKCSLVQIPIKRLGRESGVGELGQNTVALGALVYFLGGTLEFFEKQIATQFAKKPQFIETNKKALEMGFQFASQNFSKLKQTFFTDLPSTANNPLSVLDGNETVGFGAISAGLDFAAIYPMSPISNLLHFLAKNKEKYGYIYKQVEDEISAINMSLGASYAGARVLTATSGGGFALMSEGLGLAGITETPIVIIEGMRGSPATGLPTWSEQGDLRFVLHAHQGEFPRIVLLPGDNEDAFYFTHRALNLAAKYQCPVIVLTDKNICDHSQSVFLDNSKLTIDYGQIIDAKQDGYLRYAVTNTGVSPRALPGTGNFFVTNSDEHDQIGFSSEEIKDRSEQHPKRLKKLLNMSSEDQLQPILHGPKDAKLTLVGWGSTKGPILDALKEFTDVNYLQITQASPFPSEAVIEILKNSKKILDIENNSTAQMAGLLRENTGILIKEFLLKNNGRPFFPEEIINKINSVLPKN